MLTLRKSNQFLLLKNVSNQEWKYWNLKIIFKIFVVCKCSYSTFFKYWKNFLNDTHKLSFLYLYKRASQKGSFYAPVWRTTYDTYNLRRMTWKKTLPDFASVRPTTLIYWLFLLSKIVSRVPWEDGVHLLSGWIFTC